VTLLSDFMRESVRRSDGSHWRRKTDGTQNAVVFHIKRGLTMPSRTAAAICLWSWFGVVLFVSAFLIGYSFDTLGPNTMAFLFNRNTMYLHKECVRNRLNGHSGCFAPGLHPFARCIAIT
jgi:hypothetical protein